MLLPPERQTPRAKVNWDLVSDLGKIPDADIARRYNVSRAAVHNARKSRSIPPLKPSQRYDVNWDLVPLGKLTDNHLADILGCSLALVHKERVRRRIPPHGMLYRTAENQGAYYEEAIIDAWLHKKRTPHEFQKHIGPYRVDWFVNGEVWEFLGLWDHKIYGEQYRRNFALKNTFLTDAGYIVHKIHREQIHNFKKEINLRSLHSLGSFICRGCGRSNQKHQAHGLCATCAGRLYANRPLGKVRPHLNKEDTFTCSNCGSHNPKKRVKDLCARCSWKFCKRTCPECGTTWRPTQENLTQNLICPACREGKRHKFCKKCGEPYQDVSLKNTSKYCTIHSRSRPA